MKSATPALLWHYTTGANFLKIAADKAIHPRVHHGPKGEPPAVWFSSADPWEPTAAKGWEGADGARRTLTQREMCERGRGLARFGVDPNRVDLINWARFRTICLQSNVAQRYLECLELATRESGGSPRNHYACLHPVVREDWARVDIIDLGEGWDARRWVPVGGYLHTAADF